MKKYIYILLASLMLIGFLMLPVSAAELTASQFGASSNPTGNPIGGGTGYSDIKTTGDCIASTSDELTSCLLTVTSGQIIYVPATANINRTGIYHTTIPAGVTIASNRGSSGSAGGRIFQNRLATDPPDGALWSSVNVSMFYINSADNVRFTGLRIEGPDKLAIDYEPAGTKIAMYVLNSKGLEVDNCEMFGWSFAAVSIRSTDPTTNANGLADTEIGSSIANIHHNYIHDDQSTTIGYAVVIGEGSALIKGNVFAYNRHDVADAGNPGNGYEASYNIQLNYNNISHDFDVHGYPVDGTPTASAGTLYRIHHNTIRPSGTHSIALRGIPITSASVYNNQLTNCNANCFGGLYDGVTQNSIVQAWNYGNMTAYNNTIDGVFYYNTPIFFR